MSGHIYHRNVEPSQSLRPSLFFMGRDRASEDTVRSAREGLAGLSGLPDLAGVPFRGTASFRSGMHFMVTVRGFSAAFRAGTTEEASLTAEGLLEIVDYDPVRYTITASGVGEPPDDTPLHWFAYRCFPRWGACLRLEGVEGVGPGPGVPTMEVVPTLYRSDLCLKVMDGLKGSDAMGFSDGSVLAGGEDLPAAVDALLFAFREG
jgi:hypothetical protein